MDHFKKIQLLKLYNRCFWGSHLFFPCLWVGIFGLYVYRDDPSKATLWLCGSIVGGAILFFFVWAVYNRSTYGAPWGKGLVLGLYVLATTVIAGVTKMMATSSQDTIISADIWGWILGAVTMVLVIAIYRPCRPDV